MTRRIPAILATSAAVLLSATSAFAEPPKVTIELNKLEAQEKSCKAFLVVGNESTNEFDSLKLDLILFQPDGVIGKRLAVNLAPVKASKKSVKQFDLDGVACDQIGSILINDMIECKTAAGPVNECLQGLTLSSLAKVPLTK